MTNERLIVFGPGYGDPSLLIGQLAKKFTNGFDQVVLAYPDRGITQSITQICTELYPVVQALKDSYEHITFIGHSMGGLVGRELDRIHYEIEREHLFDAYISIATPHKGTATLNWFPSALAGYFSPSANDMRPGSEFLLHVDHRNPPAHSLTISAEFDALVWPPDSTRLVGVENVKIPWTTHITVMLSQRTYLEIWAFLAYDVFEDVTLQNEEGFLSVLGTKHDGSRKTT